MAYNDYVQFYAQLVSVVTYMYFLPSLNSQISIH